MLWIPNSYTISYFAFAFFTIAPLQARLDYSLFFAIFINSLGYWMKWYFKNAFLWQIIGA
jgi:hypothetical protein